MKFESVRQRRKVMSILNANTARSKRSQTCHNTSVRRRATGLESKGWNVKADIPDFDRPKTLHVREKGVRPDIFATKGKRTRIIEVETRETRYRDLPQHRLLRAYGRSHKKTEVNVRTCDY